MGRHSLNHDEIPKVRFRLHVIQKSCQLIRALALCAAALSLPLSLLSLCLVMKVTVMEMLLLSSVATVGTTTKTMRAGSHRHRQSALVRRRGPKCFGCLAGGGDNDDEPLYDGDPPVQDDGAGVDCSTKSRVEGECKLIRECVGLPAPLTRVCTGPDTSPGSLSLPSISLPLCLSLKGQAGPDMAPLLAVRARRRERCPTACKSGGMLRSADYMCVWKQGKCQLGRKLSASIFSVNKYECHAGTCPKSSTPAADIGPKA